MFGWPHADWCHCRGDINVQKFWRAAANLRRLSRINVAARGRDADHDRADRRGHASASLVKMVDRRPVRASAVFAAPS